jgi:hypothetical protein
VANTNGRLAALRERQARLQAKIDTLQNLEKTQARKDATRLKILIGAAVLADAGTRKETREFVRSVLARSIEGDRDRQFLTEQKWL